MDSGNKSSISMKYNVNEEEVKNVAFCDTGGGSQEAPQSPPIVEDSNKDKKRGSIINKYFKSLKSDRTDDSLAPSKDGSEKNSDLPNPSSGSPIKEYFNKFSKRAESVDASSETESIKDPNPNSDRWKLFSEFRVKIAQAVEDIKSSKNAEGGDIVKDENASLTDSEDNSLHIEFDASTENQVSSLGSSTQNLSELSPPIISHSNTMADMDLETTSSLETNKNLTTGAQSRVPQYQDTDDDDEIDENLEVESGVDALEGLDEPVSLSADSKSYRRQTTTQSSIQSTEENIIKRVFLNDGDDRRREYFSYGFLLITVALISIITISRENSGLNGFIYGIYFSYLIRHTYLWLVDFFKFGKSQRSEHKTFSGTSLSKIPHIVEFEPIKKYDGWINVYMYGKYDPLTYHISLTQTAFMKLEGHSLRLSFTHNKIPKHALWDEQDHKVPFYQHRIYDLTGAKIKLLPMGIVKKRHWSKKYPICIILSDKSKLTIYNAKSDVSDDNSSVAMPKDESNLSLAEKNAKKGTDSAKGSPRRSLENCEEKKSEKDKDGFIDCTVMDCSGGSDQPSSPDDISIGEKLGEALLQKEVSNPNDEDDDVMKFYETDDNNKLVSSGEWTKDDLAESEEEQVVLYLFGRTGRDKDEWFRRLKMAVENAPPIISDDSFLDEYEDSNRRVDSDDSEDLLQLLTPQKGNSESRVRMGSTKSEKKSSGGLETPSMLWTSSNAVKPTPLADTFRPKHDADFWKYMKDIVEFKKNDKDEDTASKNEILWLNALLGRVIFDMFKNSDWVKIVQDRVQKKLTSLKLPTFMGPLVVTALEFGPDAPQFQSVSAPKLDVQGLWVDLQLCYNGRATMTLTTQLNLMKLKERRHSISNMSKAHEREGNLDDDINKSSGNLHAVYHSDLDDTAESSSEDEAILAQSLPPKITIESDSAPAAPANMGGNSSAKKILRLVDKIAANKYFQHVTDYKYVKRAMEGVSNTDLKLSVELCGLFGCLTINIPPPPSDRIWFGFRGNPQLYLKAKPVVGSHTINIAHITSWIENKLCTEFEKLLVLPNMEDLQFDCMIPPSID